MNEYLCASKSCLNLKFSSCKKPVAITGEINNDYLEDCRVDKNNNWEHAI